MKRKTSLSCGLILAGLVSFQAHAQSTSTSACSTRAECAYGAAIDALLNDAKTDKTLSGTPGKDDLDSILAIERVPDIFLAAVSSDSAFSNLVAAWEQGRVDKQTGATATSAGTTDLVSKPSTSELLGLAVQTGALTQTTTGNTATLQGNAEGMIDALRGVPVVCLECSGTPVLKNINFSASFNLSQQGSKSVSTTGTATPSTPTVATVELPQSTRQLSSFTARYDIYNPLDPRSSQFKGAWSTAYQNHKADLTSKSADLIKSVAAILPDGGKLHKPYEDLQKKYKPLIIAAADNADRDTLTQDVENYFNEVTTLLRANIPDFDQKVSLAVESLSRYSQLNYDALQEARGKPQFTFEYTFNRPPSQPETHDFRLIFGLSPAKGQGLLSLNLAGTLYGNSIPVGARYGRIRDFQFAAEYDRPLGNAISHPATLSLAGYVQYQFDPSVLNIGPGNLAPGTNITLPQNAQVLLGTKGTIGILQAKVTLNTKSGVTIPIGVSWSNKTDLLNATEVRGNIGMTYDFSSISQLLTGH